VHLPQSFVGFGIERLPFLLLLMKFSCMGPHVKGETVPSDQRSGSQQGNNKGRKKTRQNPLATSHASRIQRKKADDRNAKQNIQDNDCHQLPGGFDPRK
jgi:hypothetical protein